MDIADLQDHEIAKLGKVWNNLQQKYSHRHNTKAVLQELATEAHEEFLKIGLVVDVKWLNNLVINPKTMQPYPIEIEVIGRVPGFNKQVDEHGLDHELKKHEVLRSKERGEAFYGQREKPNG